MTSQLARKTLLVMVTGAFLGSWTAATLWTTIQDRPSESLHAQMDDQRESFELDFVIAEEPAAVPMSNATPTMVDEHPATAITAAARRPTVKPVTTTRAGHTSHATVLDPLSTDVLGAPGIVDLSGLGDVGDAAVDRRTTTAELLRRYERTGVRHCYEQRLKSAPDLRGRWTVSFVVGRDGRPHSTLVQGRQVRDEALERCISQAIATWRFAPEMRGIEIEKSYGLAPGS